MKLMAFGLLAAFYALSAFGQTQAPAPLGNRLYFGGGFGASFGDVDYYDANDFSSPYDTPWVYRVGFTIGF